MDALKKGWFSEISPVSIGSNGWQGQAFSLAVEKILYEKKSDYQDVLVFKSESHGNVLVLDNIIQCTERDEFAYHEMLAHLPMFAHDNPKTVLIIGGGDGGVAREVLKHKTVERVVLCEIDDVVLAAARHYLPTVSCELDNPKLQSVIADGVKYLEDHAGEFDVIIIDSSDPIGPAEKLYGFEFYQLLRNALKPNGLVASQGQCPWIDSKVISAVHSSAKKLFPQVKYAASSVPTYTTGLMGYLLCSLNAERDLREAPKCWTDRLKQMDLKFYNADLHRAVFLLPTFIKTVLED